MNILKNLNLKRHQALKQNYDERKQNYVKEGVAKKLLKDKPYSKELGMTNYLESLTPKEREYLEPSKALRKQSKSYWDMVEQGMIGSSPFIGTAVPQIKNPQYSEKEAYKANPTEIVEGVSGLAAKPLQALGNKLGISDFKTATGKDYDFTDVLQGKQNDAGFVTDMATDLTNFIGIGAGKQFLKLMKAGNISKANKLLKVNFKNFKNMNITPTKSSIRAEKIADEYSELAQNKINKSVDLKISAKFDFIDENLVKNFPNKITNNPIRISGSIEEFDEIEMYHGSPHLYDKPTVSKPMTGEGRQAFGPGLYGSESKKVVASSYARPHFYKFKIKAEGKPIKIINRDYTEGKKSFFNSLNKKDQKKVERFFSDTIDKIQFKDLYKSSDQLMELQEILPDYLKFMKEELGIVGTKYKAGQLSGGTTSGAYNYTIFDDDIIKILDNPTKHIQDFTKSILKQAEEEIKTAKTFAKKEEVLRKLSQKLYRKAEILNNLKIVGISLAPVAGVLTASALSDPSPSQIKKYLIKENIINRNDILKREELETLYEKYLRQQNKTK